MRIEYTLLRAADDEECGGPPRQPGQLTGDAPQLGREVRLHRQAAQRPLLGVGKHFVAPLGYRHGVTEQAPHEITQRELRNDSGAIMRAVERGESFTITRNGIPIGRLIPLRRRTFVPRQEVMAAFATALVLDAEAFRADIDDQDLLGREW
ncbi:MAG: type II toxin-antitoxin system Phd/YefM family antitoxin [Pseudonocardiaceae bacterium]